ncbi:MAG: VIT1/CCC1 transporter family protein [Candidatus Dormibacteraeota bacterium]|nr:VIT1/CCC1 transporter family protein [Candidatus Dormibacteraeota bacterium]
MSAGAVPSMLGNWEREARMAELYEGLARAARNPTTRHQLERMAADERRHAKAWAGYLEGRGIALPARGPDAGATALTVFARVAGVGPAMSLAGLAEGRILRSYLGQMTELDDDAAKTILRELIPEESAHARGGDSESSEESWHWGGGAESIRNVIYGFNDGLTATLGVLAGVGGATPDPHVILVGGLAAMTASAVSMAGGAYLATKSQREIYEDQLAREAAEIEAMPGLEREELKGIYRAKGLTDSEAETVVARITKDKKIWLETQAREELGLDAGTFENPTREAVVAGVATLFGGLIPVAGYLFGRAVAGPRPFLALIITAVLCVSCLFLVGAARTFFTGKHWIRSGLEMTLVGSVVAVITYGVGYLFRTA